MLYPRAIVRRVAALAAITLLSTFCLSESVVTTIPLIRNNCLDVDPLTRLVYVTSGDSVSVISEKTNTQVDTIPVGIDLVGVGVNPITSRLYVSDILQDLVYVINTRTKQIVATIPVDGSPTQVAVNIKTNRIYVTETLHSTVRVIDGKTNTQIATISGPVLPDHLAINRITNRLYISDNNFFGAVAAVDLDTNEVIAEIPTAGQFTTGVAVDFVRNLVYAADETGILNVIDGRTNKLVRTLHLENELAGVTVDPFTRRIYLANFEINTFRFSHVDIIDGKSLRLAGALPTGVHPANMVLDPIRKLLYVGNFQEGSVTVINAHAHP
ncbi:MAG TPA: YncE family protein [Candidatus Angelobacter sp.]